jgi:hypothetical protein
MVPKNVYKSPLNHGFWGLRFQDIMVHLNCMQHWHMAMVYMNAVSDLYLLIYTCKKKHEFWWITQWQNIFHQNARLQSDSKSKAFQTQLADVGCGLPNISLPESEHQRFTSRQETESEIMTTFPTRVFRTESCRLAKTRSLCFWDQNNLN